MYPALLKVKKFSVYIFAGLGVIVVIWFVGVVILGSLGGARSSVQYNSGYQGSSPAGAPAAIQFSNPISSGGGFFDVLSNFGSEQQFAVQQGTIANAQPEGELTQRKIIRNGSLSLLVKNAEEVAGKIQDLAKRLQGFVQDSRIYEVSAGTKNGAVTIRIPSDKFDEAMGEIKKMAVKVEDERSNTSDVTERFVDLQAQLKNLAAEEEQLLKIMDQSRNVTETLNVAQHLSRVRGQIEQMQGQLQYLSRQVDMSTITVSLTAEADIEIFGITWRPLFVIKQAFRDMLTGLTGYINVMIAFIFRLPVILLWLATILVVLIIGWRVLRKIWRKFFASTSSTQSSPPRFPKNSRSL